MATKKIAPKKAVPKKAVKAAKPVAKKVAPKKIVKPVKPVTKKVAPKVAPKKTVKTVKPVVRKAALKKIVIAKPVAKKTAPKKTVKTIKPVTKKVASKEVAPKKLVKPVAKKIVPKTVPKVLLKKVEAKKNVATVKPKTTQVVVVKVIVKAVEKQEILKKEPKKPLKIIVPKTSTSKIIPYKPDSLKSVLDKSSGVSIGPTMRYSDKELAEFKELIYKKLDAAKKELSYLQGLITRKDGSGELDEGRYMTMEDGGVSMEREQLSQMASRQIQFIDHLDKAMMRIENKTYGICRVTGKLIDKARLRAVPHATLSIEAKQKQMMNK